MRQLGDLFVWCVVVAVVAGVIYFTPHIIQQVSNSGSMTWSPGAGNVQLAQEMP